MTGFSIVRGWGVVSTPTVEKAGSVIPSPSRRATKPLSSCRSIGCAGTSVWTGWAGFSIVCKTSFERRLSGATRGAERSWSSFFKPSELTSIVRTVMSSLTGLTRLTGFSTVRGWGVVSTPTVEKAGSVIPSPSRRATKPLSSCRSIGCAGTSVWTGWAGFSIVCKTSFERRLSGATRGAERSWSSFFKPSELTSIVRTGTSSLTGLIGFSDCTGTISTVSNPAHPFTCVGAGSPSAIAAWKRRTASGDGCRVGSCDGSVSGASPSDDASCSSTDGKPPISNVNASTVTLHPS